MGAAGPPCSRSTSRRLPSASGRPSPIPRCARSTASGSPPRPTGRRAPAYSSGVPGVIDIAEGENVEVDPPNRLVQTMTALWSDEVKAVGASRVTWEIRKVADSCQLTVIHDQLPIDANGELYGGWPMILSGLKTLLETGELLDTPARCATHGRPQADMIEAPSAPDGASPRPEENHGNRRSCSTESTSSPSRPRTGRPPGSSTARPSACRSGSNGARCRPANSRPGRSRSR